MAVGRRVNYSVLSALTIDGYIACNVYEGGVNQRTFDAFIRNDLLPKCNAFPGPRSVIIMDNATIHKSDVILIKRNTILQGIKKYTKAQRTGHATLKIALKYLPG